MKKVILFGSIGIAKRCLEEIILKQDIELLGVCCSPIESNWREEETVYSYCRREEIPILEYSEIPELSADIGFSIRYDKIIPKNIINSFELGIFNTHGGILPSYRGTYCNINSLINEENEYGVTLHYIDEGIDSGDIVDVDKIKINENDTGFTLYKKSEELCYNILKKNIQDIINNKNERIPQSRSIGQDEDFRIYNMKDTLRKKYIKLKEIENSLNIIRAFDSPFHEPAYTVIENQKVYLRVSYTSNNSLNEKINFEPINNN